MTGVLMDEERVFGGNVEILSVLCDKLKKKNWLVGLEKVFNKCTSLVNKSKLQARISTVFIKSRMM